MIIPFPPPNSRVRTHTTIDPDIWNLLIRRYLDTQPMISVYRNLSKYCARTSRRTFHAARAALRTLFLSLTRPSHHPYVRPSSVTHTSVALSSPASSRRSCLSRLSVPVRPCAPSRLCSTSCSVLLRHGPWYSRDGIWREPCWVFAQELAQRHVLGFPALRESLCVVGCLKITSASTRQHHLHLAWLLADCAYRTRLHAPPRLG